MHREVLYSDGEGNLIKTEVVNEGLDLVEYVMEHPGVSIRQVAIDMHVSRGTVKRKALRSEAIEIYLLPLTESTTEMHLRVKQ